MTTFFVLLKMPTFWHYGVLIWVIKVYYATLATLARSSSFIALAAPVIMCFRGLQVGKWAAMQGEAPGEVYAALLGKQCASVEQSGWYGTIGELSSLLPLSLKAELVMCDCAWECMSAWFKEREKNFTLYEVSTYWFFSFAILSWESLHTIGSRALRQRSAVAQSLWFPCVFA